jgi:uncharacterized membrane protein
MITQEFGGPLPPPSILHGYDEIIPGSAAQFVQAFHDEMEHRRDLEKRSIEAEILDRRASRQERKRGQQCGFIICMTAIIAGAVTAGLAPSVAGQIMGGVIGAGGLTSLVLAFITGRGFTKAEPKEKPKSHPSNRTNRGKRKK